MVSKANLTYYYLYHIKFQFVSLVFLAESDLTVARAFGILPVVSVAIRRVTYPTMKPLSRFAAC